MPFSKIITRPEDGMNRVVPRTRHRNSVGAGRL